MTWSHRFVAIVAASTLALGAVVTSPAVTAAPKKCAQTSEATNLKTARAWIKSINRKDWATFKKLTHAEHNRFLTAGVVPETPGTDDDVAAWQHMHRVINGMQILIDAIATSNSAEAQATEHIPGSTQSVVAVLGDIKGSLPDGTAATVPYSAWLFFKCGRINAEYGLSDASPAVIEAFVSTP